MARPAFVLCACLVAGCLSYPRYDGSANFDSRTGRFTNPPGWPNRQGPAAFLRWRTSRRPPPSAGYRPPRIDNDGAALRANRDRPSVTWIGHASTLLQAGGMNVLTDPMYSERVGLFERHAPPGVALADLPAIDGVVISHNHRDHLDEESVDAIARRWPGARFVAPLGVGAWLRHRGIRNVTELDWWQSTELVRAPAPGEARPPPRITITLVPAQHWSQRGLDDHNKTLWGGYVLDGGGVRFYFAGDTGWPAGFPEIGRRFPGIDYALLPIGAYAPRWFMLPQHIGPVEAAQAFRQLGAKTLVPIHWGTFHLSDEPMDEPPRLLLRAMGADLARVARLPIGGTIFGPPPR